MGAVVNFHLPIFLRISPCGAMEALGLNLHPGHKHDFPKDSCDSLGDV